MKSFLKNTTSFIMCLFLIIIIIFRINSGSLNINYNKLPKEATKISYFNNFIKKNDKINLILGSSMVDYAIVSDSLGKDWFSFTHDRQNIYESYNFLNFYKDSVNIDTIIIGLQPFDFPNSYIKRVNDKPFLNGNFYTFGKDSITILRKNNLLKHLQNIKNKYFRKLDKLILNKNKLKSKQLAWSEQGSILHHNIQGINLDSLYEISSNSRSFQWHLEYYVNVNRNPNLYYFDLFNKLANILDINVIYLITPKSKYYHTGLKNKNYNLIWDNILDSLRVRSVNIWDYEIINTDTLYFNYYKDITHLSYDGSKSFTEIIKQRLNNYK